MIFRGKTSLVLSLLASLTAQAELQKSALSINVFASGGKGATAQSAANINEDEARQKLANKLKKLSADPDMKEKSFKESQNGGKSFNDNDGNSFTSNTTYHSYVWNYCMEWQGPRICRKWLDPYISEHGLNGDKSPLEQTVAEAWQGMKKEGDTGQGGTYGIWKVESNGRAIVDQDGKLDMTALNKMQIVDDVQNNVKKIGQETADRAIQGTYDENSGKQQNVMPNMESLRLTAERWTKMLRNRMLNIVGEGRAAQTGVEFALGEEIPDCESYMQAIKQNPPEDDPTQERVKPQAPLDPQTEAAGLEERYKQCQQLRAMSAYKASSGDERMDVWRARANMAAIDQGGIDPNSIPKPQGVQFTNEEIAPKVAQWSAGGRAMSEVQQTNKETLESYNQQIAEAAASMKAAAALAPNYIADSSAQIAANQVGNVNLVKFNGLTREMEGELQNTDMPHVGGKSGGKHPAENLERAPSQLTVKALQ